MMGQNVARVLTEYERGLLEGIIDGEGCLYVYESQQAGKWKHWHVRLSIANNSKEFLKRVEQIVGKGSWACKNGKSWELRYSSNTLRWLLPQLNLVVNKEKKEKILRILNILKHGRNRFTLPYDDKIRDILKSP
jgi:hypothetical protein